jgi:nitric oxide reductase NorD protein
MPEPEELILEGAHHATTFVRGLWSRQSKGAQAGVLLLAEVRPRLELFLQALCGVSGPLGVAEPPAVPTWLSRLTRRLPPHLVERRALPATDGVGLRLPRSLRVEPGGLPPLARYRPSPWRSPSACAGERPGGSRRRTTACCATSSW